MLKKRELRKIDGHWVVVKTQLFKPVMYYYKSFHTWHKVKFMGTKFNNKADAQEVLSNLNA